MQKFYEVADILDNRCLTTQNLETVCREIGFDPKSGTERKSRRAQVYNELLEVCGTQAQEELRRALQKDEVLFLARRLEGFLTARGFD